MRTFNTYQQPPPTQPLARKWFIWALVGSIIVHVGLFAAFHETKLKNFSTSTTVRLVPRNLSLNRVAVNDSVLADEPEKKIVEQQNNNAPAQTIDIPKETPTADTNPQDATFTPLGNDVVKPILTDNPKVSDNDLKNLTKMQQSVSKEIDNDLTKMSEQLINDKPQTSSKSVVKFAENTKSGGGSPGGNDTAIPGMKSLDQAISSTGGGLQSGDKIGIRGGALFEFNSAELLPGASSGLKKLADSLVDVVKHHPKASFIINGYADSIGANADPQYNIDLSQRRAEAVKDYLQTAGIDASRIQAIGNGSTKFIDPPTYDPAKQALEPDNRRVEIELTFPH